MPFSNPLYTRKWTKMFAPISSFMTELGKQLGLQTILSKNPHDNLLPTMDAHAIRSNHDNQSNPLLTLFSTLTSSFRPQTPSKTSKYYNKQPNGIIKHEKTSSIYHQLNIHTTNDENNNNNHNKKTENEINQKSVLIDLPPIIPSQSDEYLTEKYIFTTEHLIWIFILTILYFTWFTFIAEISLIHLILYLILISLYFLSDRTRRFALALFIYLTYFLLYDALHLLPNYSISKVHIGDIYLIEKKFFGIVSNGQLMTLNEYFKLNHIPLLDIFTGLCYLNWIPIPLGYSVYLHRYRSKRDYIDFALTFLLTNILGFIIYYIIPAAPPWYIELYGFDMYTKTPGSPAGFENFDQLTGIKIFSSMYSKNANVFAALPSLHAAYPVITVLYGSLSKKLWLHIAFVLFTLCVWFSAVYSRHHYVLDVLAGGTCAVTAYILYRLISRLPTINRLLVAYSKLI